MAENPGPPDGEYLLYDDAGLLRQQGKFVDGKLSGPLKIFSAEGLLVVEEHYVDGRLHGLRTLYNRGAPAYQATYENGVQEGNTTLYHPSHEPGAQMNFHGGVQQGDALYFDDAGMLVQRKQFAADVPHGTTTTYYAHGGTLSTEPYEAGLLHGEACWFDPEGEWSKKIQYDKGKRLTTELASAPPAPTPPKGIWHGFGKRGK